jgi:hypothetical protein
MHGVGPTDNPAAKAHPFKLVRLKNKLAQRKLPFNLHVNAIFTPPDSAPLLVEVQLYSRSISELASDQHFLYEIYRSPTAEKCL